MDEARSLQPEVHKLFKDAFSGYTFISSQPGQGIVDERIQFEGIDIGGIKLKTDSGGNTYAQCAQYYVSSSLKQRQKAKSPQLSSCQPMLWCEISGASMRICAAGFFAREFALEPLTPALHLFAINDPEHMLVLARCCSAFRQALDGLAMHTRQLSSQEGPSQGLEPADPAVPYYIQEQYPGAEVRQLLSGGRLAFLVRRPEPHAPVIVKLIPKAADGYAAEVHRLWAAAGVAPQQVRLHWNP